MRSYKQWRMDVRRWKYQGWKKTWLEFTFHLEMWWLNHVKPCPDETFPWVQFGGEYTVPEHWIRKHLSWLALQPVDVWQASYAEGARDFTAINFRIPHMWPKGHVPFTNHEGYGRPLPPDGVLGHQGELAPGKVA